MRRTSLELDPVVESDSFELLRYHAAAENLISFQIPIGLPTNGERAEVVSCPVDARDVPPGLLLLRSAARAHPAGSRGPLRPPDA